VLNFLRSKKFKTHKKYFTLLLGKGQKRKLLSFSGQPQKPLLFD
jgi:hypothetical protein